LAAPLLTNPVKPPVTGLRVWVPVLLMMTCSWLSYIDRQAFSVLSPTILRDTGLSAGGYADAVFGFSIAYMIGNLVWGSMLDFVGLRLGMLLAVGLWTAASAAHSLVSGLMGFAMAQAVLGFGEGATFPGGLRTAADSLPRDKQSRGMGISYSGASVGAIVAPLIVTPVALRFGWRAAFVATGLIGVVWLTLWWFVARAPLLPPGPRKSGRITWPNMRERRFWLLVVNFGLGGAALGPTLYLSPLYLNRVMGLSQAQLGKVLWIPALIWELGYYFWGWVGDRFVREDPRPIRLYLLLTVLALIPSFLTRVDSWPVVLAFFSWAMFIAVGFIVMSLHLGARAYPRDQTGMVAGVGSAAWSAVVAILMKIYGPLFDRHLYSAIFISLSVIPILGTALWWWIGRDVGRAPGPQPTPSSASA
jgi:ACS family hexuronate transporter-like MFS transporter